jgi:stage III sporulation protein AG
MVDGEPVIKEEIYPVVKGIVVVASGADDISVKLNILSIIQTVIEVDNSKINIFAGKQ